MSRIVISPALAQARDHVQQLVPDARVEPDGRLVEEQHARVGDQRARDLQAAALAAAVGADRPVEQLAEPERVGELVDAPRRAPRPTPQSRACMSRFRRPVSERSTTVSWNTTLLSAARRERIGGDVEALEPRACRRSGRTWS